MNRIRVVAFDCDGVMFDTIDANISFYNDILAHLGLAAMTAAQIDYVHMHTVDASIRYLVNGDPGLAEAAEAFRKSRGYEAFIPRMKPEPNLKPLLSRLRPRFKTAIATNRSDTMERVLTTFDLKDDFDYVVCALDVDHPKPHPEALHRILDHFRVSPRQMIYIGDSELDQKAADAAGVDFVAFDNRSLTARHHITSLASVDVILASD